MGHCKHCGSYSTACNWRQVSSTYPDGTPPCANDFGSRHAEALWAVGPALIFALAMFFIIGLFGASVYLLYELFVVTFR